jgi:uncharacterized membrane protein
MGSLLVTVFVDEAGARAGAKILQALHADGTLTVYASAIVAHPPRGAGLVVREPLRHGTGAAAPAVGAAIGALVSLLGGPLTAVARTVASGLVGAVRDLGEAGIDPAFLEQVSRNLQVGGGVVVTEVEEERQLPLDARILARGGRVLRHRLAGTLAEERIVREVTALRSEVARLQADRGEAEHADAQWSVRRARTLELRQTLGRAVAQADALRREGAAKVVVLRAQAAQFEGAARTAIEHRAATVRAGLEARAARLDHIAESAAFPHSASAGTSRPPQTPMGDF